MMKTPKTVCYIKLTHTKSWTKWVSQPSAMKITLFRQMSGWQLKGFNDRSGRSPLWPADSRRSIHRLQSIYVKAFYVKLAYYELHICLVHIMQEHILLMQMTYACYFWIYLIKLNKIILWHICACKHYLHSELQVFRFLKGGGGHSDRSIFH